MLDLFVLIGFCFIISNLIDVSSRRYESVFIAKKRILGIKLLYLILLLALVFFSGLRTTYNDTSAYMHGFESVRTNNIDLQILLQPYGGFDLFQVLLKKYISSDPQILVVGSSIIVNLLFLRFFSKYSKNFTLTIFCYFILGPYVFSMAGMKQILSMSISLIAMDRLLRGKNIRFIFWIFVASTFHPYIICLLILPLLKSKIWDFKMTLIILGSIFVVSNLEALLNFASLIGKEYTMDEMTGNTINPLRVVVEIIPLFLSYIYRVELRKRNDKLLNMGINMMIISSVLIALGLFVNPIYFGRIATYFSCINAITVPIMVGTIFKGYNGPTLRLMYYAFYTLYFILDLTKLGSISIFYDLFKHINLFSIF